MSISAAEAYYQQGIKCAGQGEVKKAIDVFQKAIALDPELAGAYYNLAMAYSQQIPYLPDAVSRNRHKKLVIEYLQKSVQLNQDFLEETRKNKAFDHIRQLLRDRIVVDSKIMVGKPIIKGTRLTVEYIRNLLVHGATFAEILDEYDGLTPEALTACLLFSADA